MSVLEAMAYGKPIVGSRIGGISELVEEGKTGLLYEAGDVDGLLQALNQLMHSKGLRQQMGKFGRERVEQHFSLDMHHQGLMNIYKNVLGA